MASETCMLTRILVPAYFAPSFGKRREDEDGENGPVVYKGVLRHLNECADCQEYCADKELAWRDLPEEFSQLSGQ